METITIASIYKEIFETYLNFCPHYRRNLIDLNDMYKWLEDIDLKGNPKSPQFRIFKPKKQNYIELGSKLLIAPEHMKILESNPKKREKLFRELKRVCLKKNVIYIFQKDHFILLDRIYLENNRVPSVNQYRKTFRNVLNTVFYALDLFGRLGSEDVSSGDILRGDPSLYT